MNNIHFNAKNRLAILLAENISRHRSIKKVVSATAMKIIPRVIVTHKKLTDPLKNKTSAINAGMKIMLSRNG
ncbi:MAG: hypothetical protein ACK4TO_06650 [Candidatus Nitrosotenuis sp.]